MKCGRGGKNQTLKPGVYCKLRGNQKDETGIWNTKRRELKFI